MTGNCCWSRLLQDSYSEGVVCLDVLDQVLPRLGGACPTLRADLMTSRDQIVICVWKSDADIDSDFAGSDM